MVLGPSRSPDRSLLSPDRDLLSAIRANGRDEAVLVLDRLLVSVLHRAQESAGARVEGVDLPSVLVADQEPAAIVVGVLVA
jgi:hypothetical protein